MSSRVNLEIEILVLINSTSNRVILSPNIFLAQHDVDSLASLTQDHLSYDPYDTVTIESKAYVGLVHDPKTTVYVNMGEGEQAADFQTKLVGESMPVDNFFATFSRPSCDELSATFFSRGVIVAFVKVLTSG